MRTIDINDVLAIENIVEIDRAWRFQESTLINHLWKTGQINLDVLWVDFHSGFFNIEDLMKFYMELGYSLGGFAEVFEDYIPKILEEHSL